MKISTQVEVRRRTALAICAACVLAVFAAPPARAENQNEKPKLLQDVGLDQNLNQQVPLDLIFRDESGKTVQLSEYFGEKPVILALVYYECPMLCTQVLNGLLRSMKIIPLDVGKQFGGLPLEGGDQFGAHKVILK